MRMTIRRRPNHLASRWPGHGQMLSLPRAGGHDDRGRGLRRPTGMPPVRERAHSGQVDAHKNVRGGGQLLARLAEIARGPFLPTGSLKMQRGGKLDKGAQYDLRIAPPPLRHLQPHLLPCLMSMPVPAGIEQLHPFAQVPALGGVQFRFAEILDHSDRSFSWRHYNCNFSSSII